MRCAVHDCHNCNDKKTGNRFRFYCFPKDKQIQKEWLDFCRRTNKVNVKTARICSHHFIADDIVRNIQFEMGLCKFNGYKLKPGTVPTVYLPCESGEVDEESLTNPPPLNKMEQNVQKDLSILGDIEVKTEIEIDQIQYVEHCQDEDGNFKSLYLEKEIKKEPFPVIEEDLSILGDIQIKTEIDINPSQYVEHFQDNNSNSNIHYLEREIDKDPLSINEIKEEFVFNEKVEVKIEDDSNELETFSKTDKLFHCNECPKTFEKKSSIIRHKLVHSEKNPLQCDEFKCNECHKSNDELNQSTVSIPAVDAERPPLKRLKRSTPQPTSSVKDVIEYLQSKMKKEQDDVDILFMAHAQTIKKFSPRRQAQVKFKIAKLIMEEEMASLEEDLPSYTTNSLSSQFTFDNNSTSNTFNTNFSSGD